MCKECNEEKTKWVDLSGLPRWREGANKGKVCWEECVGEKVCFKLSNLKGIIEIIDYANPYIWIKYKDKPIHKTTMQSFCRGFFNKLVKEDIQKICKYCGFIGDNKWFVPQKNICRECNFFKNNPNYKIPKGYAENEFRLALHYVLNGLLSNINDLEIILNRNLDDCIQLVKHIGSKKGKRNILNVKYNCEFCGKENLATIFKYENSNHHYCGDSCRGKHESEIAKINHEKYSDTWNNVVCEWCHKPFHRGGTDAKRNKTHLCSVECREEWFRNEYVKREEVIEKNRQIALNNLANGVFGTDSEIQIIINNLLNNMNIDYENEYIIGNFAIDNYLIKYHLAIEINGGYWHCDPRIYSEINYEIQKNRIVSDKAKNTYCTNKNLNILYLWEEDVLNNTELCKKLIKKYIKCKGVLKEYHSFNYFLDDKNEIKLNNIRITPYMEYAPSEIDEILNLEIKYRKEYYKHYKCDFCGEDVIQLISKSNWDIHFCSVDCRTKYKTQESLKNNIEFRCDCCGRECVCKVWEYNKHKNHFCSIQCHDIFQKKDRVEVSCTNCNRQFNVAQYKIKRNKSGRFFCCNECYLESCKKQSQVVFKCDYCGKETTTNPYRFKQSKFHFCSVKCSNTFKNKGFKQPTISIIKLD